MPPAVTTSPSMPPVSRVHQATALARGLDPGRHEQESLDEGCDRLREGSSPQGFGDRVHGEQSRCVWPESTEQRFPKPCVAGSILAGGTIPGCRVPGDA
jgi:hypothetical protein